MTDAPIPCPEGCKQGYTYSSGDGWDEWDECRCCNPDGGNDTGTTTQKRIDAFRAAEAAEEARVDAEIAEAIRHEAELIARDEALKGST